MPNIMNLKNFNKQKLEIPVEERKRIYGRSQKPKYKNKFYCYYCETYIPVNEVYWQKCPKQTIPRCPNVLKGTCKGVQLRRGGQNLRKKRDFTEPVRY